jgi:hypothetical protein
MPLVFPLAATADSKSKKSKMMRLRASDSTLMGMKVSKACRAKLESAMSSVDRYRVFMWIAPTRFANSKELVGVPRDDAAGQSAPAPFYDTAEGLATSVYPTAHVQEESYQWLCEAQLGG